jgi:hypothetical protein
MSLMATARGRIQERVVKAATVIAGMASPPALVADCGARDRPPGRQLQA